MKAFKKQKTLRPTTGKVREALFDILRGKIENSHFLDLYAGTGAVGIDALNKGAAEVVFVEKSKTYTGKISELLEKRRISAKTTVIAKKVLSFIDHAELNRFIFDIIFLDPPYHTDDIIHALSAIGRSPVLKQKGIVIAEHFAKKKLAEKFDGLQKVKDYNYGDTELSFYETS
ncbi:MAG TPA: 16S rRNA (guanine(966)-N(2))-methyltransferase RsmD [Nitrospirae bacterium]|nr:16S rRNA (guanine(966)-N(2))-methyltransferase RsmD [Nitrospirota bacterium]